MGAKRRLFKREKLRYNRGVPGICAPAQNVHNLEALYDTG